MQLLRGVRAVGSRSYYYKIRRGIASTIAGQTAVFDYFKVRIFILIPFRLPSVSRDNPGLV